MPFFYVARSVWVHYFIPIWEPRRKIKIDTFLPILTKLGISRTVGWYQAFLSLVGWMPGAQILLIIACM